MVFPIYSRVIYVLFKYHSSLIQQWQFWLICSDCLFIRDFFFLFYQRSYFSLLEDIVVLATADFPTLQISCDSGVTRWVRGTMLKKGTAQWSKWLQIFLCFLNKITKCAKFSIPPLTLYTTNNIRLVINNWLKL